MSKTNVNQVGQVRTESLTYLMAPDKCLMPGGAKSPSRLAWRMCFSCTSQNHGNSRQAFNNHFHQCPQHQALCQIDGISFSAHKMDWGRLISNLQGGEVVEDLALELDPHAQQPVHQLVEAGSGHLRTAQDIILLGCMHALTVLSRVTVCKFDSVVIECIRTSSHYIFSNSQVSMHCSS